MKKINIRRFLLVSLLVLTVSAVIMPSIAFAIKPTGNLAGAQKVDWYLSGAVMPCPYGKYDITGSDTASKLIVNQPNGNTEVTITGAMNGLDPNTIYTVYIANEWTESEKWNIIGDWELAFYSTKHPGGNPYLHDMVVSCDGTVTGGWPAGGPYVNSWTADVSVSGDNISIHATYLPGSGIYPYEFTATGTISGGNISGSWSDTIGDSGSWNNTLGTANKELIGDGWERLFYNQKTFTFMTDDYGAGSWHINLRDADFPGLGTYTLSIWINNNAFPATILVSNNFQVTVE